MQRTLEIHLCISRLEVIPSELYTLLNDTMMVASGCQRPPAPPVNPSQQGRFPKHPTGFWAKCWQIGRLLHAVVGQARWQRNLSITALF
jgi:hypothetical protein